MPQVPLGLKIIPPHFPYLRVGVGGIDLLGQPPCSLSRGPVLDHRLCFSEEEQRCGDVPWVKSIV